jgi:hypothetical protein
MSDTLGTVHMCEKELLQAQWCPVDPKLVFDQMEAPVSEVMDGCGIFIAGFDCNDNSTVVGSRSCHVQ